MPYFEQLLTCMAPYRIWEIHAPGVAHADGIAPKDLQGRREAWKTLVEEAEGRSFREAIQAKLASRGIQAPATENIDRLVDQELFYKNTPSRDQLWHIVLKVGFNESIDNLFKKVFRSIFYPTCTELALADKRKELLNWPEAVEIGKALFIDAPMGLGKTYAIVEALAANPGLSAVVFMPTNRLCREIIENLKTRIAVRLGYNHWDIDIHRKPDVDDSGNPLLDDDGLMQYRFKREFLEEEVYYADGINPSECPHADEIISKYQKNWIKKRLVCNHCEKNSSCRFLHHVEKAIQARIIVTTHHQYEHFFNNNDFHNWAINSERKKRDLFIVDEDLVLSQLYQPVNLDYNELRAFIGTITDFLQDYEDISYLRNSINILSSHISNCDKTSIIGSIDPKFSFPEDFVKEWENSLPEQPFIIPEHIKWNGIVGNHLKVIEHAVRFGAVVEKWGKRFKIHLPNPKSYDLSKTPPHVFFDGTMLSEQFLSNKLSGVDLVKRRINIYCPWELRIFQNTNSDLPERWIDGDKPKVEQFLKVIVNNAPVDKSIFLITTNAILKSYLQEFIDIEFRNMHFISGYYGNIRGINDAKECDLGIMLGSFMPSDSVEIAMALEFIDPNHLDKDITTTKNNLWTWGDTNGVRKYRKNFSVIGEMARAHRHSEHRQALARTRYLFHDVDFYIVSKDRVSDYDPFLQNMVDDQYRSDLFQPRPQRPEAKQKFDEVAQKVFEWLKSHDTVKAVDIHRQYQIRRQTVGQKLSEMHHTGLLAKKSKTIYKLPDKD